MDFSAYDGLALYEITLFSGGIVPFRYHPEWVIPLCWPDDVDDPETRVISFGLKSIEYHMDALRIRSRGEMLNLATMIPADSGPELLSTFFEKLGPHLDQEAAQAAAITVEMNMHQSAHTWDAAQLRLSGGRKLPLDGNLLGYSFELDRGKDHPSSDVKIERSVTLNGGIFVSTTLYHSLEQADAVSPQDLPIIATQLIKESQDIHAGIADDLEQSHE